MKLAILVVYMVSPENEKLMDLHLEYIDKYTADYTIYATVNKLLPQFQEKLNSHPRVKICSFPAVNAQNAIEHSYYLERLTAAAIEDGASHLAVLHVDSFPIEAGWAEKLAEGLSEQCVLATLSKKGVPVKPTACLFFTREFYLKYQPAFRLTTDEMESDLFRSFEKRYPVVDWDSGMGYIFKAFASDLSWLGLERIDKLGGCAVYGDMIFHLEGALILGGVGAGGAEPGKKGSRDLLNKIKYLLLPLIPKKFIYGQQSYIRKIFNKMNRKLIVSSMHGEEKGELFADPEAFIARLKANGMN